MFASQNMEFFAANARQSDKICDKCVNFTAVEIDEGCENVMIQRFFMEWWQSVLK